MFDDNNNNLTGAVISVSGINHDVTAGRWALGGSGREFSFLWQSSQAGL